ncbi:MAG: PxKF domain-containing protein [Acidobacteria bacterium]|nr:PxKF domain-containing protein [Acidobacteriota bacterium]
MKFNDVWVLVFNQAPVANAGTDQTVECCSSTGTPVTLDGTASNDPDGDALSYEWKDFGGNVVGNTATVNVTLPLGTHTFTLTVSDGKGGTASDSVVITVQDTTPPTLTLSTSSLTVVVPTASATGAAADLGGIATATDACDPDVTITNNAPALFPLGTSTVTFTATDDSGNYSQKQLTVHVVYNFIGFLAPIRMDGSSIFKSGRTIPVKFQLTAADSSFVTNAVATLQVFKFTDVVLGATEEITADAAGNSNMDNLFRYDAISNQYIYNLKTTGYTAGSYLLRATLNDGTAHEVIVSVRM